MKKSEEEIIREYESRRMSRVGKGLWKKYTTLDKRREILAPAHYTAILKRSGKEQADAWIIKRFGEEKGRAMLSSKRFMSKWIKEM